MKEARRLTAVIKRQDDGFVALCPELDIASHGSSMQEVQAKLVEALSAAANNFMRTAKHRRASSASGKKTSTESFTNSGTKSASASMAKTGATADTNIYISAFEFGGRPRNFIDLAAAGEFRLDISEAILTEILRVLQSKCKWSADELLTLEEDIASYANFVSPEHCVSHRKRPRR